MHKRRCAVNGGKVLDRRFFRAKSTPVCPLGLRSLGGPRLVPEETVLILGATGVTGKLAVQIAKLLGQDG